MLPSLGEQQKSTLASGVEHRQRVPVRLESAPDAFSRTAALLPGGSVAYRLTYVTGRRGKHRA
jgi:hypothetical protein